LNKSTAELLTKHYSGSINRKPNTMCTCNFWVKYHLEKPPRENQYLVDFIRIKFGLPSWDNGPLEENTNQQNSLAYHTWLLLLCCPFAPFLGPCPCTLG
jgi:hypothetical protein